jgi:EmrB/QacA subfamily drug resistance transporter
LAVILTCQLLVAVDLTIVNIALPKIQTSLHFSPVGLSWVFDAYALTFGGLLLLGGRAGDLLGRRRVLIGGVVLFIAASLLGGLADTAWWLVSARAVQGVGGALIAPNVLALIATNFDEGPPRNRAISLFGATTSASLALGLVTGGVLTAWSSWRWVLWVNVPIGVAIVLIAPLVVQETQRQRGRFDVTGACTATAGTAALVYGFIQAASRGWSDEATLGALAIGVVAIAVFISLEIRADQPIMPLRLFASRNRTGAYLVTLFVAGPTFAVIYFLSQFLQEVRGYSPLMAGLAFLPMTIMIFSVVRIVPRLFQRYGVRPVMVTGATVMTAALAWLTQISATSGYVAGVLGPLVVFGLGSALTMPSLTVTTLTGVSVNDSGAASGILQTMQWIGGGSLGLAVLVTVYAAASRSVTAVRARGSLLTAVHDALAHGVDGAFTTATLCTAGAVLVAAILVRQPGQARQLSQPGRIGQLGAASQAATSQQAYAQAPAPASARPE